MWIRTVNGIIFIEINISNQGLICPKQSNEHNALVDTKWNYELYKFIQLL